jgi:hypothetical protein
VGSEWEPIKILLEGDTNSNKMNSLGRTPKITRSALLPSVCQNHVATEVLLVLGTNSTSSLNSYTHTAAETTRDVCLEGAVRPSMGAVRPPPPGDRKLLRNSSSEHQNTSQFHQQKSLIKDKLAIGKSW